MHTKSTLIDVLEWAEEEARSWRIAYRDEGNDEREQEYGTYETLLKSLRERLPLLYSEWAGFTTDTYTDEGEDALDWIRKNVR